MEALIYLKYLPKISLHIKFSRVQLEREWCNEIFPKTLNTSQVESVAVVYK
jgi:hypothetical protein